MSKDHRLTSGRYGAERAQLSRDDFASIIFTMLPVDVPSRAPGHSARAGGPSSSHWSAGAVPRDVIDAARGYCSALAQAWPEEPIAVLADTVADVLADPPPTASDVEAHMLYAAALLCNEEAARIGAGGDLSQGSAQAVSAALKKAAAGAGVEIEPAFDG